jgi:hypothetical protein
LSFGGSKRETRASGFRGEAILEICRDNCILNTDIYSYLSFSREDILEINHSETRIASGGHVC